MMRRKRPDNPPARRRRFHLPPWLSPAVMLCVMVPMAMSQDAGAPAGGAPPAPAGQPVPAAAPAGVGGDAVEEQVIKTEPKSLLEWFQDGGMFMYPIALCSVLALAIVIERLLTLRAGQIVPSSFVPGLKGAMRDLHRDREAGLAYCRARDHALARVVAAGIRKAPRGVEAMEKAVEDQGASEALRLRRNMRFLYAIASVATLLGLIGTIQGMIQAFQAAEVVGTGKFGPLAKGIYIALITTFAGLSVAIPVTVIYYFLAGRIERIVMALNDEAGEFLDHYTGGIVEVDAPLALDVSPADATPQPIPAPLPAGRLAPGT